METSNGDHFYAHFANFGERIAFDELNSRGLIIPQDVIDALNKANSFFKDSGLNFHVDIWER